MNMQTDRTEIEQRDTEFDHGMRQLHATAVSQLSPQTLARLRAARHAAQTAPRRGHAWRWVTATAFSAVLAVALGVQFLPRWDTVPAAQPMVATVDNDDGYGDSLAVLDESPDLYMWLASSEAEPLAME
jgi:anti-sigma-K factor RskA